MEKIHQIVLDTGMSQTRCGRRILSSFNKRGKPVYSVKFTFSDLDKVTCWECLQYIKMAKEKYEKYLLNQRQNRA